jgi:hypothetical protein
MRSPRGDDNTETSPQRGTRHTRHVPILVAVHIQRVRCCVSPMHTCTHIIYTMLYPASLCSTCYHVPWFPDAPSWMHIQSITASGRGLIGSQKITERAGTAATHKTQNEDYHEGGDCGGDCGGSGGIGLVHVMRIALILAHPACAEKLPWKRTYPSVTVTLRCTVLICVAGEGTRPKPTRFKVQLVKLTGPYMGRAKSSSTA